MFYSVLVAEHKTVQTNQTSLETDWRLQVWFRWDCWFEYNNGGSSRRFAAMPWVTSELESVFFFQERRAKSGTDGLDGKDGFVSSWYEFDSPTGSTDEALSHRWSDRMKLACDGWWWTDGSSNHLPNIFSGCLPFFQTVSGRASPDGSVQQTIWNGRLYFRLDHTTISFTGKIAPLPKWLIADYWVSFSHSSNS